jgi:hypothetical protein
MKNLKSNKLPLLILILAGVMPNVAAGQQDSIAQKEIIKLHYFNSNNSLQYLVLESLLKKGKQTEAQKGKEFKIFLDKDQPENLVAKLSTDNNGKAKAILPPELKNTWDSAAQHTFLVVSEANSKEDKTTTEFTLTKAKISIDTSSQDGTKNISVAVMKYENSSWVPVKDVEMKIGIERLGGILPAGGEDSYTTDSTGTATSEFKKEGLPGDEHGNLLLIARVEDNDELGNLVVEKTVPWGVAIQRDNSFFSQRALWSTRFRTPLWLLFMAYSIVIGVWGTIFYLIIQLIKIRKLAASSAG